MTNLLLCSVFKPYGIDDAYGRKENKMELFHNQVTRGQGIFSMRSQHRSFGLYVLAENIEVPTVVLDFPSLDRFVEEIKKAYDYIGISFITPNFVKARKMAELVRIHAPRSKIILGGHGTRIPDLKKNIPCDYLVEGDGIVFLRKLFAENLDKPFRHPLVPSSENKRVLGMKKDGSGGVLVPGVGCGVGCKFCCTSSFFGQKYTSYLTTGEEVYEVACRLEKEFGSSNILIQDENFLRQEERAKTLLSLVEKNGKLFKFNLFSSADSIARFGVENLARLGVGRLWIGVESRQEIYQKNRNIDLMAVIDECQRYGIVVLASTILFLESHRKANIYDDIDYTIGLHPDFVQFSQLCPLPKTPLYEAFEKTNRLDRTVPYERWHGQDVIWFDHPHFSKKESKDILGDAFQRDYDILGPSLLRVLETTWRGFQNLSLSDDDLLERRSKLLLNDCKKGLPILKAIADRGHKGHIRIRARRLSEKIKRTTGSSGLKEALRGSYVSYRSLYESARLRMFGDADYQPETLITKYRCNG